MRILEEYRFLRTFGESRLFDGSLHHIGGVLAIDLQVHAGRGTALDIDLVEAVEVDRIQLGDDGLLAIDQRLLDTTLGAVLGVELQLLHHVTQQDARLQHLHLVVDTGGVAHDTQVHHVRQHLGGVAPHAALVTLDEQSGRHLVGGLGIAEVKQGSADQDDEREQEILPIEHQCGEDGRKIDARSGVAFALL